MTEVAIVIPFTWKVIVLGAVIVQGLFAALVLVLLRKNRVSNRLLASLLVASSLWLLDAFFENAGVYGQNPDFYFLPIYFSFAFGPLIYFYVQSLTGLIQRLERRQLVHFVPVFVQFGLYLFLTCQDYSYRREFWFDVHQPYTRAFEFNATFLSLTIYLILAIQQVWHYQSWIREHFSELSRIRLHWLRVILLLMLLLCIQWLIELILRWLFSYYAAYDWLVLILGLLTLTIAVGGILQANLSQVIPEIESEKESNAALRHVDQTIIDQIRDRMDKHKDYLSPELTLSVFAKNLSLPPRVVSQHINHGLGKSFIDFVNEYRVNMVMKKLSDGMLSKQTLLSIAYESGFNSKSTFNRIFKQQVGSSPTVYLQKD